MKRKNVLVYGLVVASLVAGCDRDQQSRGTTESGATARVVKPRENWSSTNAADSSALANAVNYDKPVELEAQLRRGANPNIVMFDGSTVLHGAVGMNRLECVKVLLKHGADATIADQKGQTPLHKATIFLRDPAEMIAALLEAGAPAGVRDAEGKTALDYAVEKGSEAAAGLLRKRAAPATAAAGRGE